MKRLSLVLTLVMSALLAYGQGGSRIISGKVIDADGEGLIGASILIRGTSVGTVTDIDGNFELTINDPNAETLVISYTGYGTEELTLTDGNQYDITLEQGVTIDEVVVTGLGIRREKKALGYGVSTIDNRQIQRRVESDVSRILRGKAPGVDITQTSGLAGSGTNIIIRGYSSITGSNQPLFVVDGVPLNTGTNNDAEFQEGGATASSRFLDLDPNNIETISVLKGLSATVLYGEAGRNGVILVTTRAGSSGTTSQRKNEITVTQNVAFTEVANLPDYQDTYGNGFSGDFGWFFSNWGPAFDVRGRNGIAEDGTVIHPLSQAQYADDFPELQGARYDYRPYDNVGEFFQRGFVTTTSVNANRNFANGGISASYSYLDDEGFVETSKLARHNGAIGGRATLENGLQINASLNFVSSSRSNPPASTGGGSGPQFDGDVSVFSDVLYTPRSIDLANLPFESPIDNRMVYYRRGSAIQNPRWGLKYALDEEAIQRFFGNISLSYPITKGLTATYRAGVDNYSQANERSVQRGGSQIPGGIFRTSSRVNTLIDQVLNFEYDRRLGDDFSINALVGYNGRLELSDLQDITSENQFVFGLSDHSNFENTVANTTRQEENTIGVYGTASVGFRDFLYLNFQGRNDWTSTLEQENRSIFYPSVSASFVPTDAFAGLANNSYLNYLKLRVGYGTSAGYPDPYQTRNFLTTATRVGLSSSGQPLNTNSVSNRLGNPNLLPERHNEAELGIEGRFVNNRIGVDLSLYNKNSQDLIIDLDLDPATGFTNTTTNAAEITNRGIELGLNFTPFRGDFYWDIGLNFTRNRNIVNAILNEDIEQILIAGFTNLGNFAVRDRPYGVMRGTSYVRNDAGQLVVDQGAGSYITGDEIVEIGDPNPNYQANWINNISYKGINFGFQWQYIDGGDVYSTTTATMLARGLTTDTDFDRFLPIILPGVDGEGNTNTVQGYAGDYFFDSYFGADEGSVFDGTVIRLREVSLGYEVPEKWLAGTPIGSVSLRLIGENLFYNAPNFPPGVNFDPEVLSLGVGNGRGFDFLTGPTAKKYGLNVAVSF